MGDSPIPGYSTVFGAAKRTGLHVDTIRYHCRQGHLDALEGIPGRGYLIPDAKLEEFIVELNHRRAQQ